jgi:hypothetical protein
MDDCKVSGRAHAKAILDPLNPFNLFYAFPNFLNMLPLGELS